MISYSDIIKALSFDCKRKHCIEIEFLITGNQKYGSCWMGKTSDESNIFWYGLMPDGSESYDYTDLVEFVSDPVFNGRTLEEIWDKVEVLSVDGCDPEERIAKYTENNL